MWCTLHDTERVAMTLGVGKRISKSNFCLEKDYRCNDSLFISVGTRHGHHIAYFIVLHYLILLANPSVGNISRENCISTVSVLVASLRV